VVELTEEEGEEQDVDEGCDSDQPCSFFETGHCHGSSNTFRKC
jgi:hypothetical protein